MPPPLKMQIFKVVLAISSVQLAVARDLGASFDDYVDTLGELNEDPWQGDFRGLFRASGGPSVGPTEAEPTAKPTAKPTAEPEPEPTTTEPSEGPFNPDPSGGPAVSCQTKVKDLLIHPCLTVKEEHKAVHGPTKFVRLQYNAMSFDALNKDKAVQAQLQNTTKETMINANPAVSLFYTLDVNFHASEGRRLTSSGRRLTSSAGVIIETAMVQKNVSAADLASFSSNFSADIGGALTANIASSVDVSALLKDGHAELGVPHVTVFVAEVGSDAATATLQIVPPTAPPTTAAPATTAAPPAPPTTAAPAPATTAAPTPPAPATSAALPGTTTTPAPETAAPSPTPPVVPVPGPTPATTDVDEDDSALSLRLLWAVGAMMAPYLMI